MNIQINPKFRNLIPPLSADEYRQLTENIVSEGCRDALVVWNGFIIDGHNRYDICQKNGIKFKTEQIKFSDESDAKIWIIKNQFGRRNITDAVRGLLALELEPLIAAKAQTRKVEAGKEHGIGMEEKVLSTLTEPIDTRKEVAKVAGVSTGTMYKVKKVRDTGTLETLNQMRIGKISINKAFEKTVSHNMPDRPMKTCSTCLKPLPVSEFPLARNQCKSCRRESKHQDTPIPAEFRLKTASEAVTIELNMSDELTAYCELVYNFHARLSFYEMLPTAFKNTGTGSKAFQQTQDAIDRLCAIKQHIIIGG